MKKTTPKIRKFGIRTPRKTRRNLQIKAAVEKAVDEYKEAYRRLAAQ